MQLKKIGVSSLLLMLLLGIFAVFPARADFPANAIWVEPQVYNATENGKTAGDTFTVSVWINVTADLYGFEYKLQWNDTLIKHVSHTYYLPWTPNFVAKDQAIAGQYWFGASALAPAAPYTGSMKVLDITFQIAYQPYYPESNMSCPLDLVDTKLGDPKANPILHVAYDGLYEINTILPSPPNLSVTPPEINAIPLGLKVNDTFQVNINIIGLASAWDLYGWEVKLGYNSTLLEVTNVASGGFLTPFQGPYGTFFTYRDRPEYNYVVMAELFLGTGNKQPYGTGTLAVVTFKIIYEEAYPKQASCPLNIFDIKLVSSQMAPISVGNVSQGMYYSPMSKPAGAVIDIYTESFRWPGYYTTNTGETGVDLNPADADAVAPQENITLYAKLTYSQAPVQFKEVAWQINAPNGEVYYRQSFTNESGIATISIRIPWWEDYFGTWTALAKSSVAEVSVNDTVTFVVGYIVTVNSSVTTDPAYRGEDVNVTVWLNNIGTINRDVFVSITIYDDVGMPIASYGRVETVTPGVSTEPFTYTLTLAPWAHVGQGTVYINLFTGAPPSECGVCYGPEHVQTFTLKFVP
jgi:hypothetical protein